MSVNGPEHNWRSCNCGASLPPSWRWDYVTPHWVRTRVGGSAMDDGLLRWRYRAFRPYPDHFVGYL